MPTDVVMPQMGESITEGTITKWLKKPGDTVQRDEPLFEISTDKVDAEIPSPAAGTLEGDQDRRRHHRADQHRRLHHRRSWFGQRRRLLRPRRQRPAAAPAADSATPAATRRRAAQAIAPAAGGPGTEVLMPQMGESITEGTITKWLKKVGDTVQRDEPIFEISTDKVDAEIPSPVAGILTEIKVPEGTTVTINTVVAVIGGGAGKAAAAAAAATSCRTQLQPRHACSLPPLPPAASAGERVRSSPLVRKIAKDNNVDLSPGSRHRLRRPHHEDGYRQPSRARPEARGRCSSRTCHCRTRRRQARRTSHRSPANSFR